MGTASDFDFMMVGACSNVSIISECVFFFWHMVGGAWAGSILFCICVLDGWNGIMIGQAGITESRGGICRVGALLAAASTLIERAKNMISGIYIMRWTRSAATLQDRVVARA